MGGPLIEDDEEETFCSAAASPASRLDPPTGCEEPALPGGELCYWHDPDGWALDYAETLAESRRDREW